MLVLDTTVLVYAKGADHSLRDPCRDLIDAIAAGGVDATTTPEVIQEFTHVRAHRRDAGDAVSDARDYAELLAPLLTVGREQLDRGLSIFASLSELGTFDAVLAATAIDADARGLVSADRAFAKIKGIEHVLPDAEGITRILREAR